MGTLGLRMWIGRWVWVWVWVFLFSGWGPGGTLK